MAELAGLGRLDPDVKGLADLLTGYSIRRQLEETDPSVRRRRTRFLTDKMVVVIGEVCSEPLMIALQYSILEAGGHPVLRPYFSGQKLAPVEIGSKGQYTFVPESELTLVNQADAYIAIRGTNEPYLLRPHGKKLAEIAQAWGDIKHIREGRAWVVTKFPSLAEAVMEGFGCWEEYWDFIKQSCLGVDYPQMSQDQEMLKQMMSKAESVTIKSHDPTNNKLYELHIELGASQVKKSDGRLNMPDGEVYVAPYPKKTTGKIFLDVPIIHNGEEISGVYLEFKDGRIVDYNAQNGQELLKAIIETDEGSNYLGEVAFGTNHKVDKALKEILFTEKIGGTVHIAIGCSLSFCYPDELLPYSETNCQDLIKAGRYNKSAQHLDLVVNFRDPRQGEGVFIGNTELSWTGKIWAPK